MNKILNEFRKEKHRNFSFTIWNLDGHHKYRRMNGAYIIPLKKQKKKQSGNMDIGSDNPDFRITGIRIIELVLYDELLFCRMHSILRVVLVYRFL